MKLGISKGRGFLDCIQLLAEAGISVPADFRSGRLPIFNDPKLDLVCAQTRAGDLPWLLDQGFLDVAITSPIIMEEYGSAGLVELAPLNIQICRLSLIGELARGQVPPRRVCTRYPRVTLNRARSLMPGTEIIRLSGSHEISLSLGFADAIVDVVESGWTLQAMRLVEWEVLYPRVTHGLWAKCGDESSHDWLRTFLPAVFPAQSADCLVGETERTQAESDDTGFG
jgi:ATP phosphoribosyltransferase